MDYILLDTSFTSFTCRRGQEKEWDIAISSLNSVIPNFEKTLFKRCSTPLWFIEHIGLGKFRKTNKNNLLINNSYEHFIDKEENLQTAAVSMIDCVRQHVESFYRKKLTAKFLKRHAIKTLQNNPYHHLAVSVKTDIKLWRNSLDDRACYDQVIGDLVFDTLLRYPYILPRTVPKKNLTNAIDLYSHIYHCLVKTFIEYRNHRYNLSGFSVFHEINNFWKLILSPLNPKANILRSWDDLFDPELIHYAHLGWYQGSQLQSVLVITCENQENNLKKLKCIKKLSLI